MNTTSTNKRYFDLFTFGIGRLQRVRKVPVPGGKPYLACTVAALVGPASNPVIRHLDVNVLGNGAKDFVKEYLGVDDSGQRPMLRFTIGDVWARAFIKDGNDQEGEPEAVVKGRLLTVRPVDEAELSTIEEFELITKGIGYVKRVKARNPLDSAPSLSCTIAALVGRVELDEDEKREYRYFDTIVARPETQQLVRDYIQPAGPKQKVFVAFKLNDLWANPYFRTRGDHAGELGASLGTTLAHLGPIKVDGKQVYPAAEQQPATEDALATADTGDTNDDGDAPSGAPTQDEPDGEAQDLEAPLAVSA
ncbi:TPA: DUF3577 domain-containing protein [Pseudomonas aeruginosa]|uniref:DUF3577 domain-containing protein n=1 Tax=Pseudomonas aeruginosa TaxID=287 RepID=UPI00053F246C|nr:DUF3577 domain-containing protein [Pseudomonas aeruginosa]